MSTLALFPASLPNVDSTEWRSIPGHPMYEASSDGRVRSWVAPGPSRRRASQPHQLKPQLSGSGYYYVFVGLGRREGVHVLVALAFSGPRNGRVCRHRDGNQIDNSAANICWGTPSENEIDKRSHGTSQQGERHPQAKLTATQIAEIRAATGTCAEIGARYGISRVNVGRIRGRRTWRHIP